MMHWTRILVGVVLLLCCGIAWAVYDVRRNLKRIKIAQAVIIATEEGDKILEAVQIVGVAQIENHKTAMQAAKALRVHVTSNHDEIDGGLKAVHRDARWLVRMFDRYLKFESRPPVMPPDKRQTGAEANKDDTQ